MADWRELSPTRRKISEDEGDEFPFPHISPPTRNDTASTSLKNRESDPAQPKRRSRSHSRSASSISNLLLVATERLGQETNRANALDARCGEVLTHLRTIVEERDQLRRTLGKVQEELSLYKLQLEVAQNEIFRAQKIVDDVDKARVEAEEQAAKDRTLLRQLASERAVWVAREEGRSEGFEEGLREGRRWAYEAARRRSHSDEYTSDGYEDEVDRDLRMDEVSPHRSSSSRRHWSPPSRSAHSTPPDAASYASTLPIHAMAPSSHYQYHHPPRPESAPAPAQQQELAHPQHMHEPLPHPPPAHQHHPARTPSRPLHSTPPDTTTFITRPTDALNGASLQYDRPTQQQSQPPRPRSTQQHPRRPQSAQQLPQFTQEHTQSTAPHLNGSPLMRSSRPLPAAPAQSPEPIDIRRDSRPPSPSRSLRSHRSRRSIALPPDGIPTVGADSVISLPAPHELSRPVSIVDTPATERGGIDLGSGRGRTRTMSNVSAVSTRLSQFDILCPPRAAEAPVSLSDQVAREWRVANGDPTSRQGTTEESHSSENFSIRSSAPRSQASLRSAPRRPREIVMPTPLSTAMHAVGGVSYTQPIANSSAPPPPIRDPYSAPSGPSSVPTTAPPPHGRTGDTTLNRPRSAMAWIKSRLNRTTSSNSVINIEIEPPSNPTSGTSTDCTVNNILLTPEHAGTSTLPHHFMPELAGALAGMVQLENGNGTGAGAGNVIVLPDNELPRGFVPLSPILPDLHTVPGSVPVPMPGGESSTSAPSAPRASPQPPAYTPHDVYAVRELPRPATATPRTRSPPRFEVESARAGSSTRARGASIGSAMLASPPSLARPILFSEI